MKRIQFLFLAIPLAIVGLFTVPLGVATIAFRPIVGIVVTSIGCLTVALAAILVRKTDRSQRRHRSTTREKKLVDSQPNQVRQD